MIAVSGMHNIMYIGPFRSGKTMLAQENTDNNAGYGL